MQKGRVIGIWIANIDIDRLFTSLYTNIPTLYPSYKILLKMFWPKVLSVAALAVAAVAAQDATATQEQYHIEPSSVPIGTRSWHPQYLDALRLY